jgi:hypothetical protein
VFLPQVAHFGLTDRRRDVVAKQPLIPFETRCGKCPTFDFEELTEELANSDIGITKALAMLRRFFSFGEDFFGSGFGDVVEGLPFLLAFSIRARNVVDDPIDFIA